MSAWIFVGLVLWSAGVLSLAVLTVAAALRVARDIWEGPR